MDWKIEETEEGVKVECRYYEPAPRSIDVESDKRAIAVLEKTHRDKVIRTDVIL